MNKVITAHFEEIVRFPTAVGVSLKTVPSDFDSFKCRKFWFNHCFTSSTHCGKMFGELFFFWQIYLQIICVTVKRDIVLCNDRTRCSRYKYGRAEPLIEPSGSRDAVSTVDLWKGRFSSLTESLSFCSD